jgi:hypothetical protein
VNQALKGDDDEVAAWRLANSVNTAHGFDDFCHQFPQSAHLEDASRQSEACIWRDIGLLGPGERLLLSDVLPTLLEYGCDDGRGDITTIESSGNGNAGSSMLTNGPIGSCKLVDPHGPWGVRSGIGVGEIYRFKGDVDGDLVFGSRTGRDPCDYKFIGEGSDGWLLTFAMTRFGLIYVRGKGRVVAKSDSREVRLGY